MALLNDTAKDAKIKFIESGTSQVGIAEKIGSTGQYINRLIKNPGIVNKTYLKMFEAMGYDIELVYVKREK